MTEPQAPALALSYPWQQEQWRQMLALQEGAMLPHALLLAGPPEIGKRRFAMVLGQALLCESPTPGGACGRCRQCGFNRAGSHPDFKLLEPEESGRQIKIDQVREVVNFLSQTSQQGGYKVTLIQPAESMNINAANALLKSLEEPAGKTLLILLSDAPGRLLATVRSRCRLLSFPLPSPQDSLDWLNLQLGNQSVQAETLLAQAQGRPLAALALLESGGLERARRLSEDYGAMIEGRLSASTVAEGWKEYELTDLLVWLEQQLIRLIKMRTAAVESQECWQGQLSEVDSRHLFALLDRVNTSQRQLAAMANPNRQLLLEDLLIASCDIFRS